MSRLLDSVLDPVRLEQCRAADEAATEQALAERRPAPPWHFATARDALARALREWEQRGAPGAVA